MKPKFCIDAEFGLSYNLG